MKKPQFPHHQYERSEASQCGIYWHLHIAYAAKLGFIFLVEFLYQDWRISLHVGINLIKSKFHYGPKVLYLHLDQWL